MSRINTQNDRLGRTDASFELQRSFLVQPQRFAVGNQTSIADVVGGLGQALGRLGKIKKAESQDLDNADYISVLEMKNKAETSPEEFGPAYLDSVTSALENVRTPAGKARLLGLNAEKQVTDWQTAQQNQRTNQQLSAMNAAMTEWMLNLDPTDRKYIEKNDLDRFDTMVEEWNQTLTESPELEGLSEAIENDPLVRAQFLSNVKQGANVYSTRSNAYHATQRDLNQSAAINGSASKFALDGTYDIDGDVNDISTTSKLPPDVVRSELYAEAATQIGNRVQSGQVLLSDGLSRLDDIEQRSEGLDDDAALLQVNKVRTELVSETVSRASQVASIGYYEDVARGESTDEALQQANNVLVSTLESITGEEIDDDLSISQILAEPGTANLNAVLGLASAYNTLVEDAAERNTTRTRPAGPTNSAQLTSNSPLKYYNADQQSTDPESAQAAFVQLASPETKETWGRTFAALPTSDQLALMGQAYGSYASVNFAADPDRANFLTEAVENNGPAGMQYTVGAITNMPNNEFESFVNDMPEDESYALAEVRDEAMRMKLGSPSMSLTSEQIDILTTTYNAARSEVQGFLESRGSEPSVSSTQLVLSDESKKRMVKAAGFEGLMFSPNALNQIQVERSKYGKSGADLNADAADNAVIRLMSRNGLFYVDSRKDPNQIQYSPVRGLTSGPEAYGVSREQVADILGPNTNVLHSVGVNLLPALIRLGSAGDGYFNVATNREQAEILASSMERTLRGGLSSTRPTVASRRLYSIIQDQFGLAGAWPQTFGVDPDQADIPRAVAPLLSNILNTEYLPPGMAPLTALQIDQLLRSDPEDPGGFLTLDIGADGVLFARGRINTEYFQGAQSITLMDFPPELYQFGQTIPSDTTVDTLSALPSILSKLPIGPILP